MFKDLKSNEQTINLLQNELKQKKRSGTYLFNGKKGSNPLEIALAFSKAILCVEVEDDFCDECSFCKRVNSGSYPDVHFYGKDEPIKIDEVREIIYKASSSSFEGNKRIFILENIESLRKEAANALLKTIEEPENGTYFMLISNSLNILPTILSRSIIINVAKKKLEDLMVTKEEYDFFFGDIKDIEEYKASDLSIERVLTYENIGIYIKEYLEEKTLDNKIKIYLSMRDFYKNGSYLSKIDKIYFAEEMSRGASKDRKFGEELLYRLILLFKPMNKMEELLELKSYIMSNVNLSLAMKVFVSKL